MIGKIRKSQEEMVGFVLIIVIVAIIGVIFLALSIKKPSSQLSSSELNSFLYSSLKYTSSCYNIEPLSFRELVTACQENKQCDDETRACDTLNRTATELIEGAFVITQDSKYKGYSLRISKNNETLLNLKKEAKGNIVAGEVPIYGLGGNSYIRLELYY
ncbi:MAG: hypothetical protein NT076_04585 [Candidatus Pacearchaeota archaeon]|nr:hypothetical protein [Candidatus Pacearchaeota archaeon]